MYWDYVPISHKILFSIDISIHEDAPHSDKVAYVLLDSYRVWWSGARRRG